MRWRWAFTRVAWSGARLLLGALATALPLAAAPSVVVVFGDAGAARGLGDSESYAQLLARDLPRLGFPAQVIDAALAADPTPQAIGRLGDVLSFRPQAVVLHFGLDDARLQWDVAAIRRSVAAPVEGFEANLRQMIERLKAAGAAVIVVAPATVKRAEEYGDLAAYRQAALRAAADHGVPSVDLERDLAGSSEAFTPDGRLTAHGRRQLVNALLARLTPALERR